MFIIDIVFAMLANWLWPEQRNGRRGGSDRSMFWFSIGDTTPDKDDLTDHRSDPNDDYYNDSGEGPDW